MLRKGSVIEGYKIYARWRKRVSSFSIILDPYSVKLNGGRLRTDERREGLRIIE